MNSDHASEMDLQQYVSDKTTITKEVVAHIEGCPDCQASVAVYAVMFGQLQQQPLPAFDYDVSELVLARIMTEQTAGSMIQSPEAAAAKRKAGSWVIMAAIILFAAGIPVWLFRISAFYVFTGVSSHFLYLILPVVAIIVSIKVLGMYRKYHRQIKALQF